MLFERKGLAYRIEIKYTISVIRRAKALLKCCMEAYG